ncbi:LysR substrate-binding domain-containing protein [Streptomyces sp. NPDC048248]|uniref:LysR substrate-binding domain-containing protein n=1 Tax=Streptomyces sp. NPDC048248 TaxID=3365523 RepID=UPI003717C5E7
MLPAEEADLALVLPTPEAPPITDARCEQHPLLDDGQDLLVPEGHPCAAAEVHPLVRHQVKEWFAVSALVAAGFGVCLLPRTVPVPAEHGVVRVPLKGQSTPSRKFMVCTRRGSTGRPALDAGLAALHAVSGEAVSGDAGSGGHGAVR